jgi:hypothetical protein
VCGANSEPIVKRERKILGSAGEAPLHRLAIMRPQKITFGEMREMGVRGVLVYCALGLPRHAIGRIGMIEPGKLSQHF